VRNEDGANAQLTIAVTNVLIEPTALTNEAPVREAPVREAPVRETSVREMSVREAPVREAPVRETSVREAPVRETSVREAPVRETSVREASVREASRPTAVPSVPLPRIELPVEAPPPAVAVIEPATPAAPGVGIDQNSGVREVLARYESAYSRLDAAAARAVWPSVDQRSLARAFDGLASQRVALGRCDLRVNGMVARATCSGSAEWTPKVGTGQRSTPRTWSFELRSLGGDWQIVRADAR